MALLTKFIFRVTWKIFSLLMFDCCSLIQNCWYYAWLSILITWKLQTMSKANLNKIMSEIQEESKEFYNMHIILLPSWFWSPLQSTHLKQFPNDLNHKGWKMKTLTFKLFYKIFCSTLQSSMVKCLLVQLGTLTKD